MTAFVRLWPPEFANAAALLADEERFLSAVGQRHVLVPRQRGRRSTVGYPKPVRSVMKKNGERIARRSRNPATAKFRSVSSVRSICQVLSISFA
jgi:hypothetical protein